MDDETLLAALRKRDPKALDTLLCRYGSRVLSFSRQLTRSQADAEDLTQETFLAAFQGAPQFAGRARLLTWLLGISYRRWRDARRTPRPSTIPLDESHEGKTCDQSVEHLALKDALARLPENLREAFVLVAVQQQTHAEAARVLSVPRSTIKWRVGEAARLLRPMLSDSEE
jgi:RNA polymerase sigma-70 factor, ECF subfamily